MAGDGNFLNRLLNVLVAFDDTALSAITSVGLVRRARKDLEKETVVVEAGEVSVQIRVGDGTVTMTDSGPADARCTCPSGGKCRHVLVATMHLKERMAAAAPAESTSPVAVPLLSARDELLALTEDLLVKWAGRKTLRDAIRLVEGLNDIEIVEDSAVTVRFPSSSIECRYFPGTGLAGVVSTAPSKLKERFVAAAVIAYQRQHGIVHETEAVAPVAKSIDTPRTRPEILASACQLLEEMVTLGIAHVSGLVRDRLQTLSVSCAGSNLPRLSLILKSLADEVAMTLRRDAGADDIRMFQTMSRAYALCSAIISVGESASPALIGKSRSRYDATGAMELSGVGAYAWRTRSGYHGLTVLFWDGVAKQCCTWSDSRPVAQDPAFNPVSRYEQDLPWQGSGSARIMSRSRIKLSRASRNEDNRLSGSEKCQAVILTDTDPATIDFGNRAFDDWSDLFRYLAGTISAGLEDHSPLDRVVVLKPTFWGERAFLSAEQTLVWPLLDASGLSVILTLPFSAVSQRAVESLEAIDPAQQTPPAIIGTVSFDGTCVRLFPYSLLTHSGTTRIHNLNLDPSLNSKPGTVNPANLFGLDAAEPSEITSAALDAIFRQWIDLEEHLQRLAESGTRRVSETEAGLLNSIASRLTDAGLVSLSNGLTPAIKSKPDARMVLRLTYLCRLHKDLTTRAILLGPGR